MKKYTIKNVEITKEELLKLIKENPELVEDKHESRYFEPKEGETYFFLSSDVEICESINAGAYFDNKRIAIGVYNTLEKAEHDRDIQKAIVRVWKIADTKFPFVPNWSNTKECKYFVRYDHGNKQLSLNTTLYFQMHSQLPHFKSKADTEAFIKECEADLKLILNVK